MFMMALLHPGGSHDLPFGPVQHWNRCRGTNTDGVPMTALIKGSLLSVKIPTEHASYAKAIDNLLKALTATLMIMAAKWPR